MGEKVFLDFILLVGGYYFSEITVLESFLSVWLIQYRLWRLNQSILVVFLVRWESLFIQGCNMIKLGFLCCIVLLSGRVSKLVV